MEVTSPICYRQLPARLRHSLPGTSFTSLLSSHLYAMLPPAHQDAQCQLITIILVFVIVYVIFFVIFTIIVIIMPSSLSILCPYRTSIFS
jgi:hypothetical protein